MFELIYQHMGTIFGLLLIVGSIFYLVIMLSRERKKEIELLKNNIYKDIDYVIFLHNLIFRKYAQRITYLYKKTKNKYPRESLFSKDKETLFKKIIELQSDLSKDLNSEFNNEPSRNNE